MSSYGLSLLQRAQIALHAPIVNARYSAHQVCDALGFFSANIDGIEVPVMPPLYLSLYYGGWSLAELAETDHVVCQLDHPYANVRVEAGHYAVQLPLFCTDWLTREHQYDGPQSMIGRFYPDWSAIPAPIAATALAVHKVFTGEDLLQGAKCRCAELLAPGYGAVIEVPGRRAFLSDEWNDMAKSKLLCGMSKKLQ